MPFLVLQLMVMQHVHLVLLAIQPLEQEALLSVSAPFVHLAMEEPQSRIVNLPQVDVLFVQLAPTKLQA